MKKAKAKAVFDCMVNSTVSGLLLMLVVLFITPKTPLYYFIAGMGLISILRPYVMILLNWELRKEINKYLCLEYDEEEEMEE